MKNISYWEDEVWNEVIDRKEVITIQEAIKNKKTVIFDDLKIKDIWEVNQNENIGISTDEGISYHYDYEIFPKIQII